MANTSPATETLSDNTKMNYDSFKVRLAEHLTTDIILKLATLFMFTPAEKDQLRQASSIPEQRMVSLMEEKGQIKPNDISPLLTALDQLGLQGLLSTLRSSFQGSEDFGRFKVRLAELLTAEIILKLAMLFKFTPAENDELRHAKKSTGLLMVSFMAERGQIKPNDISPLLTALDRLGLQGLLSTLRSIFQGSEDKTYQFVRCLKSSYKQLYSKINPIPYIREKVYRVNEIFVEGGIEIHRRDNKDTGGNRMEAVKLKSYHDVFNDDIVSSKRILLEGDPGYGKSTFTLQAAYDWCNASESSPLKDVAIFILLPLRRLGGISLVCQAIKLMLMPGESKLTEEDIMEILRNSPGAVLVFDGYDEYPDKDNIEKSEILKIIAGNMFAKFKVITCTRSSYIPDNLDVETVNVRLTGFDDNARDEYISRAVAVNDNQEARRINGLLTNSPVLSDICQVPLFCVMFVHISYDSKHILSFASVTSFFRHILTCFYEHMRNKMGHARKRKDCYVIPHHPKLSKLLFDALTGKNQQIVWQKDMFKTNVGDGCYNELLSIGILLEEDILKINDTPGMAAVSVIERTTVVRFYHKLFAEWYAANYLSTCAGSMENEALSLQKEFEKINPVDLQFVFRFACGLNKKAFSRIIKYLKGIKDGQSFAILCFPEQVSEPDDEVAIVKDLLTGGVTIRSTDSRFLQRLTKQILDIAAKSDIPITSVCLNKSFKECEKDVIVLHSGLRLNQLLTVEKIHIETEQVNKEPRILTEEELTMIFRYGLRSKHLKDLSFDNCLLPPSFASESIPAGMKSRDIKVLWRNYGYSLNLESGAWKVDDVDTVKRICTKPVTLSNNDSELLQRWTIQLVENASQHDIPISSLLLGSSFNKVDEGDIVLQSGLCLPTLSTLEKLSVVANLAELTEVDVIGLLNYGEQSRRFKELSFYQCKLPTSISPESIGDTARSRNIKVLLPDTTRHLDLQSGKWKQAEDIQTITELCSSTVIIHKRSNQESQKSIIETLEKASRHDIPIDGVGLFQSFNKVDKDVITLYSGLTLPILTSLEGIYITTKDGREMNEHEVIGILNYVQHSQRFKELHFSSCLLPPSIASSSLANLNARNVHVLWAPYVSNERAYLLDLQSGRWLLNTDPKSFFPKLKLGEELTDADYANEVEAFRNRYRFYQSELPTSTSPESIAEKARSRNIKGSRTPHYGSQTPLHDGGQTPSRSGAWDPSVSNTPMRHSDSSDFSFDESSPSSQPYGSMIPSTSGYSPDTPQSGSHYNHGTPGGSSGMYGSDTSYSPYQPTPSPSNYQLLWPENTCQLDLQSGKWKQESVIADTLASTKQNYLPYKQPHVTPCFLKVKQSVNSNGGKLEIPYSGVSLEIPSGALEGQHWITLNIIPNYQNETGLSSVVVELLPRNMKLLKRAKLTLPHCLVFKQGCTRKAKIYSSDHEEGNSIPNWKEQTDIPYDIMEQSGVLWLKDFCWKTLVYEKKQVKGKNVVLYAAKCHPFLSTKVHINIGYYLDLPGNDQIPLQYNNIEFLQSQPFVFLKKNGPLEMVFKESQPSSWTLESELGEKITQKEILVDDIALKSTGFCNFVFKKTSMNVPEDCFIYFTAGQASRCLRLIFPLKMSDLSPNDEFLDNGNDVCQGTIMALSKRIVMIWKDIARNLKLTEHDIERLAVGNVQTDEVAFQMLLEWQRKHHRSATKAVLSNALIQVERGDLVNLVEKTERANKQPNHESSM